MPTPYLLRPLEHGADIVVHSTTKFLAGHGTAIGGIVVDGGRFDFGADPERWPGLTAPDRTYDGLSFQGPVRPGFAYAMRLRTRLLRDLGPAPSPYNSFLLLQGVETLDLRHGPARRERHGRRGATSRRTRPCSGCTTRAWRRAAGTPRPARYLPAGAGAVLAFELRGGRAAGTRFVDALRLFSHLANIGDVRSLAIHPASTTHAQLDPAEQLAGGVTPGLVRLSVGIEGIDDLIADLDQALAGGVS